MNSCITMPIAIIGLGCRLPGGVTNLSSLWSVLATGRDCIGPVPSERWDGARFYHPERTHPGSTVTLQAGLIDHVYDFDADFFGISPKEAESMDPQQKILLELTWEAMEDAGILPSSLSGSDTAVFVGAASPDGGTCHADDICATSPYSMTGTNLSIIANRISYIYNFHGPSFTLDTACSSSLYALHQACQILAAKGASLAFACGVNVLLAPYPFVGFSQAYMLSPEGRCKVFDASGNGYVRSEGGGALLLEPLDNAIKNGHHIHAVIKAVACNSDGRTQGIALPSSEAQESLLSGLYETIGCDADALSYLEAHGTGTVVGDPLETRAIGHALGMKRSRPLPIGSVKCNVGHLETASAMAGIVKSIAMLRERKIPKQLHITRLNPDIDFDGWNLHVPLEMEDLPEGTLRIGVNSFGFGGANGHVLLEEAPQERSECEQCPSDTLPPLFLSARSENSLAAMAGGVADYLSAHPEQYTTVAKSLALHRETLSNRLVATGGCDTVIETLRGYAHSFETSDTLTFGQTVSAAGREEKTAFVFAGNGCHWLGMGRDLLSDPVFRAKAEEVSALFTKYTTVDFLDLLQNGTAADLEKTENTQPLIFLIQICICAVLAEQGIRPDIVFGHSVGEVAAVWAAGLLSLPDAVKVVYYRSVCQGKTRGCGKMAAAKLSLDEFLELSKSVGLGEVELAGINAPGSLTLCGSERGLRAIGEVLAKRRVFFKMLPLDYAFHSSAMETIKDELLKALSNIRAQQAHATFLSTVAAPSSLTPLQVTDDPAFFGAEYWWLNIRRPVMFHAATTEAVRRGVRYFLEISPHAILQQYIRSAMRSESVQGWVGATMQRKADNVRHLHAVWCNAWTHGWPFDSSRFFAGSSLVPYLALPTYPWNRTRLHIAETPESQGFLTRQATHPLLGWRVKSETSFENVLDLAKQPWLGDHRVGDSAFYPAACYLEMTLACARSVFGSDAPVELSNTAILRPVILDAARSVVLRTCYESADGEVRIYGRPFMQDSPWVLYSRGRTYSGAAPEPEVFACIDHPESFGTELDGKDLYTTTLRANMHYGPVFQPVEKVWINGDRALARFCTENYAASPDAEKDMLLPPALLDGGLQLLFVLLGEDLTREPCPRLPFWFDRCIFYRPGRPSFASIHLVRRSQRTVVCDIDYLDAQGKTLLSLRGGRARSATRLGVPPEALLYTTDLVLTDRLQAPTSLTRPRGKDIVFNDDAYDEYVALQQACAGALIAEHFAAANAPAIPKSLSRFMQAAGSGEDLPPFALLWQTLLRDWPEKSSQNLLLLACHARLVAGENVAIDGLLTQYFAANTRAFSEEVLAVLPDPETANGPETVICVAPSRAGFLPLLQKRLAAHSLWLTEESADALQAEEKEERIWSAAHERTHRAAWMLDSGPAPAPKASLILACNILHDCNDLLAALRNCRESLLPGGRFCLFETAPSLDINLAAGLDESWWQIAEDSSLPVSGLLPAAGWQKALTESGFSIESVQSRGNALLLMACRKEEAAALSKEDAQQKHSTNEQTSFVLVAEDGEPLTAALYAACQSSTVPLTLFSDTDLFAQDECAAEEAFARLFAAKSDNIILPLVSDRLENDALSSSWRVISLAKAWQKAAKPPVTIWLLTFGAYAFSGETCHPSLASAIGAARVILNEMPALRFVSVDLPAEPDAACLAACATLLQEPVREREYVLRSQGRFILRSHEIVQDMPSMQGSAWRLAIEEPGHLERLAWHRFSLPEPSEGEVRIAVQATGLNFRDVMWAMNLLPEEALENGFSGAGLGIECAGVVDKVGPGVTGLTPGAHVVAFGPNCFSSHIVTQATACAAIPGNWDFAEAASVPVTFFTAYYAICHLARMTEGERILIHGAAGGVGLAAIQIALSLGLEVYATAGSPLKRHLLATLGVPHIYDSRSLAFRDQILADTEGEGVDCVVNSLAGEAMSAGLAVLKPFGRFLELGKSDFFADSALRLRPFRNNISYFGIDVDQLMKEKPKLGEKLFSEMMAHFADGEWTPLPCTIFAADEVEQAFRFMQKSQHVGKIIVTPPASVAEVKGNLGCALPLSPEASYLISGGLGGFGLESARYLVEHGAGALLLISRSGETDKNRAVLDELRILDRPHGPCRIKALACDVTDAETLARTVTEALADMPPLKGVLHAAAVLDDALVEKISRTQLAAVLGPKVRGAFALHELTKDMELDFFILYSSVTTLMGNPGQVNYVAANMAMEHLAAMRRSMGLPGLAVGWGAIAGAGMLERDAKTLASLTQLTGIRPLKTARAMDFLAGLPATTPSSTYVFAADWHKLRSLPIAKQPRLAPLIPEGSASSGGLSLLDQIRDKSEEEAHDIVLEAVTASVARILRTSPGNVRPTTPLQEMGIDSLMGVELSLALEDLMDGHPLTGSINATITVEDLTARILKTIKTGSATEGNSVMTDLMESHGFSASDKGRSFVEEALRDAAKSE